MSLTQPTNSGIQVYRDENESEAGGAWKSMCARKVVTCGPVLGLPSPSRRDGAAPRGSLENLEIPSGGFGGP